MDPEAAAAFARAAALLQRDEHLDDFVPSPPRSSYLTEQKQQRRRATAKSSGYGQQQPVPRRRQPSTDADQLSDPSAAAQLPSLAELSTTPVLDLQKKVLAPPRAGRRAAAPIPSGEEGRKAAMTAMEAAMPSLDEESARLVARACALIDGTDSAARSPMHRSPARRGGGAQKARASTRSAPARGPPTCGSSGCQDAIDFAPIVVDDIEGVGVRDESGAAEDNSAEDAAAAAAARARELSRQAAEAVSSAVAAAEAADAVRSPGSASSYGRDFGAGGGFVMPTFGGSSGSPERAAHIERGAEGAQQRVRQARLAEEKAKQAEREAAEQKRAAAQADAARVAAFQSDVQKRAAMRKREERERQQREAAAAAEEAAAREARKSEQAREAEEVRRSLAQAIAARRAVAKQREIEQQALKEAAAQQAKVRNEAEGAKLQAAALARVRERRRQEAVQRGQEQVESELEFLARAPKLSEGQARAKEHRAAAADRLRLRRERELSGSAEDGFLRGQPPRQRGRPANAPPHSTESWADEPEQEYYEEDEEDGSDAGDGWFGAAQDGAFSNVGFVIRGEEPARPPAKAKVRQPRPSGQPRQPQGRPRQQQPAQPAPSVFTQRGGAAVETPPSQEPWSRGGALVESTQDFVAGINRVGAAARRGQRPLLMPSPAEHPTSEGLPPAQVLEIRSPERRGGPDDCNGAAPSHQPWQPAARARLRFDPPPVAPPEVDEELQALPPNVAAEQTRDSAAVGSPKAQAKPARRKPWQRAPVPLDRPLDRPQ